MLGHLCMFVFCSAVKSMPPRCHRWFCFFPLVASCCHGFFPVGSRSPHPVAWRSGGMATAMHAHETGSSFCFLPRTGCWLVVGWL
uniref:Putative secreted protein n=1 Tax=Anopheles marajoara TaxID=58244 RepID=A0A2M4CAP9_9DIPT